MSNQTEIIQVLDNIDLFNNLSAPQLREVAALVKVVSKGAGSFLTIENQLSADLFVILSGRVQVGIFLPGHKDMEQVVELGPGEVIGELALVGAEKRSASVQVVKEAQILVVNLANLLNLLESDKDLGYHVMRNLGGILASRLIQTTKSLGHYHFALRLKDGA